jgi:uncharacterized membrane protein
MNGRPTRTIRIMSDVRSPTIVFTLLCLACLAQAFYFYPQLPDQVAMHFDAAGEPDAWSSKLTFIATYIVTVLIMALLFTGSGWLLRRLPDSLINIPNKAFWLAPARREQTFNEISALLLWLGSATLLLLLDMFHQSFQVHLGEAPALTHPWVSLSVYLVAVGLWLAAFVRHFTAKSVL